jgi:hypothetical protein
MYFVTDQMSTVAGSQLITDDDILHVFTNQLTIEADIVVYINIGH